MVSAFTKGKQITGAHHSIKTNLQLTSAYIFLSCELEMSWIPKVLRSGEEQIINRCKYGKQKVNAAVICEICSSKKELGKTFGSPFFTN